MRSAWSILARPWHQYLPTAVEQYTANLYSLDASLKYRGWSLTTECYFRLINEFEGATVPDLFDFGYWIQLGKFVVPKKLQVMTRWSWVDGDSGTLGANDQYSSEIAVGLARYFRGYHAKLTFDATYLDGAPDQLFSARHLARRYRLALSHADSIRVLILMRGVRGGDAPRHRK